jgi:hypothetical protein
VPAPAPHDRVGDRARVDAIFPLLDPLFEVGDLLLAINVHLFASAAVGGDVPGSRHRALRQPAS